MPSYPAAAAGVWGQFEKKLLMLGKRLRAVETSPPQGMLNALRVDASPPAATGATDSVLWRIPAPPAGAGVLIGVVVTLTGTAAGTFAVYADTGQELIRLPAPYVGDVGPLPAESGMVTVVAQVAAGTGSVVVDVTGVRYGRYIADDTAEITIVGT